MRFYASHIGIAICLAATVAAGATVVRNAPDISPGGRRIVGGEPTQIEKHPWQIALTVERQNVEYLCGGSIIAQKWVVSAAHCFLGSNAAAGVKFKAGVTNIEDQGVWTDVEAVVLHEGYNKSNENDIALVKLKAPPAGRVIPLVDTAAALPVSQPLEVTGWGTTKESGGVTSDALLRATVPYVDNTTCNAPTAYAGKVVDGMMCAGHADGGIDACQGDSGGPLVWRTEDGPVLVGVVSYGDGCARKLKFGVYTRVSAYRAWIFRTMGRN
jgi:trypsin